MNTVLSRINALLAYTLSILAALTFVFFLSTFFNDYQQSVAIKANRLAVKSVPDYSVGRGKNDLGHLTFDLDADLSPLFNWNCKQLFIYLVAEYSSAYNVFNEVVVWDKIISRGQNAVINVKDAYTKYYFWDDGHGLRGNKNVSLTLKWNVIPNAGLLPNFAATGSHTFSFPAEYSSTARS